MAERALIIESDAAIAGLLDAVLNRQFEFDIIHTRTIGEGIDALRNEPFKAVIVDISLSSDRLEELTSATRKQDCGVVVLTTGRVDRKALELFVHDHVYAVFPKPFDVDEVARTVRESIEFAKSGSKMSAVLHGFLKNRR